MANNNLPEFRFFYFTNFYEETVSFYRDTLELNIIRSWDRSEFDKGTLFTSPNSLGIIEIEKGEQPNFACAGLYIEVENVDEWYDLALKKNIKILAPLSNTTYGHRSFRFEDPNGFEIGLFKYNSEKILPVLDAN